MTRRPIEGTPTMIRHHATGFETYKGQRSQLVGIVTSVSTCEAFTVFFHVHRQFENGKGYLHDSGGSWSAEAGAVKQWEQWVKAQKSLLDNDRIEPDPNDLGIIDLIGEPTT